MLAQLNLILEESEFRTKKIIGTFAEQASKYPVKGYTQPLAGTPVHRRLASSFSDHPVDAYLILGYEPPSLEEREEAQDSFLE
jgi:hypothetical protein